LPNAFIPFPTKLYTCIINIEKYPLKAPRSN